MLLQKLLKDGGKFDYGLSICDIPLNFEYGLHQGKLAEGIEEYGFNVNDFMMMNDVGTYGGGKYKIKLSEQTPDTSKFITPDGAGTNESTGTKPAGASTAAGGAGAAAGGAAATGDTGIIVAAATLLLQAHSLRSRSTDNFRLNKMRCGVSKSCASRRSLTHGRMPGTQIT